MKKSRILISAIVAGVLLLSGCSRDPEVVKRRYLENGNKYFDQGRYKEAVLMYRNALKKDPKFGEAYLKLGDAELRRGALREAVGAYRRAVDLLPGNEDPAGKLADIFLTAYALNPDRDDKRMLKEVEELVAQLKKANPTGFHSLRLQGFMAVANEDMAAAVDYFRQADQKKPDQPELRFALAQVLLKNNQAEESEKVALDIIAKSPKYAGAYDFLAAHYGRSNRMGDAEKILKQKVSALPESSRVRLQLAVFYLATQRRAEADKVVDEMIANAATVPNARSDAADLYFRLKDFGRARQILEEGVRTEPEKKSEHRRRLAVMQFYQGQPKEALAAIEQVVKDDPNDNNSLALRAAMQLQSGDPDKSQSAINDLQTLLGKIPKNAAIRYNLARAYQSRGELDAARVQFIEAIKQQPSFTAAHIGLGQVSLGKRDFGKAIESADAVLRTEPKNLPARVIKVNALLNSGNLSQARAEVDRFLVDAADSPDLRFQQGLVYFMEKKHNEAEAVFRKLMERYPGDLRLLFGVAETMVATNRAPQALEMLQTQLKARPNVEPLKLATGNVALRVGNYPVAEREFRALLAGDPKSLDLHMRLGETLRRMNRMQESMEVLRKGQSMNPNNPQVNLQLAMTLDAAGMQRESMPLYENIVKNQPDNAIALNNLAYMLAEEGRDLDLALTYAQRARQQMPGNPDVADTLGWVYIKKQLNDNAVNLYREILGKAPNNPLYHYHLGLALYQKGDRVAAKRSLQTALTLNPPPGDGTKIKELLGKIG